MSADKARMHQFDITILTDRRYALSDYRDSYSQNVVLEDALLGDACRNRGLKVFRTNWDNAAFDWASTRFIMFRSTWDYFDRFDEFSLWLEAVCQHTTPINPLSLIQWNLDKFYLRDLQARGVLIPPTLFVEKGDNRPLSSILRQTRWREVVIKPAVSGAARHTYRFPSNTAQQHEAVFRKLVANERMLVQEFQANILSRGEVSFVIFGGRFSHAVLKYARPGDFRVQDDFGGRLEDYIPSSTEIATTEQIVAACDPLPVYARVDLLLDNAHRPCLGEIELIEPELWFRKNGLAADRCADAILSFIATS